MNNIDLSPEAVANTKALAQMATPGLWQPSFMAGYISIGPNPVYIAAFHPGVILAMCEEIERLRAQVATQEVLSGEDDACMTQLEVERDALEEQVGRLEKEADWLAQMLVNECPVCGSVRYLSYSPRGVESWIRPTAADWREAARKAVEGA